MNGKILKISNNDLYGNVDDRTVSLFAAFTHTKYMNKYAIFTFTEEYNKKKLYYASIHLKESSIITFSVREDEKPYIEKFVNDYLNNQVDPKEYELLDISNINKIELVSNTQVDFEKLNELDALSIPREKVVIEEINTSKKPVFLYILLIICLLFLGGIIYLHYNPNIFEVSLKKMDCTKEEFDKKLDLPYKSEAQVKFDNHDELLSINVIDTYSFNDNETYLDFKDNHKESLYFDNNGAYKYDDEGLTLKIIYEDKIIIYKYDEILRYMKKEGYSCIEGVYNE